MYSEKETMDPLKFGEIGERFYTNPLSIRQIGDPFILNASDNRYYCYATSAPDGFRVWYSEDLIHWKEGGMAFQREADSWAVRDFWAPEVIECNGKYHMFFSAREAKTESLRIGTSISDNPLGPFEDPLGRPLFDFGYAAIDASVFLDDDGSRYLYYSRDCSENIINGIHESHIYGVGLSDDMLSVASQPVLLMRPEQRWEEMSGYAWRWNEGPIVRKHDSVYYLFYSANYFASVAYSVGYGTAESPLGPFRKSEDNPILMSKLNPDGKNPAPLISGPGHNSFAVSPNGKELFLVYHTHTDPEKGGGDRQMNLDRIGFRKDGSVYVNGPTLAPQVLPSGAGRFRNAALEARVSASSIKPGYKTEALTDGELGFSKDSIRYDWVSDGEKEGAWVRFEWDEERIIDTVILYPSQEETRRIEEGKILINDKIVINDIKLENDPNKPGLGTIVPFYGTKAKSVEFLVGKVPEDTGEVGLAEIYILEKD